MKKILLSFVGLLTMAVPSFAATKTYQLCTDETEILNPDNQFLMLTATPLGGAVYAAPSVTSATINGVKLLESSTLPETVTVDADALGLGFFTIKENGTYKAIYENVAPRYWGAGSSSTNMAVSATLSSTSTQYQATVSVEEKAVKITTQKATTRYFAFQCNSAGKVVLKNYASSNLTGEADSSGNTYSYPVFYKEVEVSEALDPTFSGFDVDGYTMEIGEIKPLPTILPSELDYTFSTENEDVIELNTEEKTIKALKEGVATIKFSTEATEEFNAGEGEFTVTVNKVATDIAFHDQVVFGKLNVGVVWQEAEIVSAPENLDDRGRITYSSSDETIVNIDPETGRILPEDVLNTGIAIITATMEERGDYAASTATYTVVIKDAAAIVEPGQAVFDFSTENAYGMTSTNNSGTYEKEITEITDETYTASLGFTGSYRSWKATNNYELRMNKDDMTTFTVSVPEEYRISSIGICGASVDGVYEPLGTSEEVTDHPEDWTDLKSFWYSPEGEVHHTVTFNSGGDGASRIHTIYVQYEAATSGEKSARLSFGKVVNGIIANEEATINAVVNPNNFEINYRLVNVPEEEYSIIPTEDGKNLKVTVANAGVYTLEATSPANDEYRSGYAIMRLNVYNHLDVFENGEMIEDEHIAAEENSVVTMIIPENNNVYFRLVDFNATEETPDEEETDENREEGFTLYEDQIDIPAGTQGELIFYLANYGYKSPKRTLTVGEPIVEPVAPSVPELEEGDYVVEDGYIKSKNVVKINFKAVDGVHIYYSVGNGVEPAEAKALRACDNDHAGYTKHEGEEIELTKEHSTFSYYACDPATGLHSEPVTFQLAVATGIEGVEAADNAEAIYFDLQGVQVASPENGVFVRISNGKAEKVVK